MMSRGRRPPIPARARGAALIMLMALLTMGVLYFLTVQLEAISVYQRAARGSGSETDVLNKAKEALLDFAATYRDKHPVNGYEVEVFGYLPCPDRDGDGEADPNVDGYCNSVDGKAEIGLLPYKTLGLPDLRDAEGNCLWYAVAGNFKANSGSAKATMNWDTQGQFEIVDANATSLVAPDDNQGGAAAVIFAVGPPIGTQARHATESTSKPGSNPCKVNLRNVHTIDGSTNPYPTSASDYLETAFNDVTATPIPITSGAAGSATNNDRLAWVTPKEIIDRVVKRKDFSNPLASSPVGHLNKLTDEIRAVWEKKIQDDLVAGTTTASQPTSTGSFTQPSGKKIGSLPASLTLNDGNYTNYYNNWSDQYRQAICSTLANPCLTVAGTSCRGALMFGGRNTGGGPRTTAQKTLSTTNLGAFFESGSGLEILNSATTSFSGLTAYTENGTAASRALDVGTCLFPGSFTSFAQDIAGFASGVTYSGATASASVNTVAKTVTLGDVGGAASSGCVWYATPIPLSTKLRLYFRLQFATKGDGFTLALADGATNLAPNNWTRTQIMCGSTGSTRLGYAGSPSGSAPGIQKPKIGIEFDTLYSATRSDPPGDHMAFLYWGTTSDSDGSDDNTHYLGNGGVTVTNASWAGGTATLTTASPHGFSAGQTVLVSGLTPSGYNGTVTISSPTSTQFSYALTTNPGAYASGGQAKAVSTGSAPRNPRVATAILNAPVNIVASDTFGGTTRTTSYSSVSQRVSIVTSTAHGLSAGDQVIVSGVNPAAYNGTFTVLSSGLSTTRPYRFRYSMSSNPGVYVSGGTATKVKGAELSGLTWAGATASATSPVSHGLTNGQNITTYGMTPSGFGATANLTLVDATHFTFPLATNPVGSFSTETPAGMAMVKTTDTHLPYSAFPTSTSIYVRLDLSRNYDSTNHVAVMDMKAYIGDSFPLAEGCSLTLFKDLSLDLSALCPSRETTLQQDSTPINALATLTNAVWSSASSLVTVTTAAAHGLVNGSSVTISGATPITYNGTFTITVTGANTFTYAAATNPGAYVSGGDLQPLAMFYLGFTNARGSSNSGEDQNITIYDLIMRSQ